MAKHEEFELQHEYWSFAEVAALMGKKYPKQISQTTRIQEPEGWLLGTGTGGATRLSSG